MIDEVNKNEEVKDTLRKNLPHLTVAQDYSDFLIAVGPYAKYERCKAYRLREFGLENIGFWEITIEFF